MRVTEQQYPLLKQAVKFLAGRCDYAHQLDGVGFNKFDANYGHSLASGLRVGVEWSPNQARAVWKMLGKYKGQLGKAGIDYDAIPEPANGDFPEPHKSSFQFVLIFGKHQGKSLGQLAQDPETREYVDWLARESWTPEVREAARATLAGEPVKLPEKSSSESPEAPKTPKAPIRAWVENDEIYVYIKWGHRDFEKVKALVKEIPGRRFHKERKGHRNVWVLPLVAAPQVVEDLRGLAAISEELEALAAERREMSEELADLSSAHEGDFEVAGLGGTLYPFQKVGVEYAVKTKRCILAEEMGLGKAQSMDAKILTPKGWIWMGAIKAGDRVIGGDGKPCHVTGVYPQGQIPIYRVAFSDGSQTECCFEHLWQVNTPLRRWRKQSARVFSLATILEKGLTHKNGNRQHFIPMVKPIEFDEWILPLSPYLVGALLGDGGLSIRSEVKFHTSEAAMLEQVGTVLPQGMAITERDSENTYALVRDKTGYLSKNPVLEALRNLGLKGLTARYKFIPHCYKFASVESRVALLQGLMDTDGSVSDNHLEFGSSSEILAYDVQFLVQSLGGTARMQYREKTDSWRVSISLPDGIEPFRLPRKAKGYTGRPKYPPSRSIVSVELVGMKEAQCIAVDSPSHLYVTDDCIVTHNTIEALATLQHLEAFPAVVVCPASLKLNWAREARKWLPGKSVAVWSGRNGDAEIADVVIINYDIIHDPNKGRGDSKADVLRDDLKAIPFKAVILDEGHYIKSHTSRRSRAAKELGKGKDIRLLLTGTPILNRPQELLSPLAFLGRLNDLGGFWFIAKRYANAHQGRFGWDMSGAANLDELHDKLRATCYVRRLKSDVLTELPAKTRAIVPVEITNRREYERVKADVISWFGERAAENVDFQESIIHLSPDEQKKAKRSRAAEARQRARQAEQLVKIEALKQVAVAGKMGVVKEWIANFLETGEKLVVFAYHREVVKGLAAEFKEQGAEIIIGGQNLDKRDEAVRKFQEDDDCRLIVSSIKAGGVGITLTAASNVLTVELGWTPADHSQAEDRLHRIGQAYPVTSWWLVAANTIEEDIAALIDRKKGVIDAAVDGEAPDIQGGLLAALIRALGRGEQLELF